MPISSVITLRHPCRHRRHELRAEISSYPLLVYAETLTIVRPGWHLLTFVFGYITWKIFILFLPFSLERTISRCIRQFVHRSNTVLLAFVSLFLSVIIRPKEVVDHHTFPYEPYSFRLFPEE